MKNERGSKEMTDRMSRIKVKAILLVVMLVLTIATGVTAMASAKSGSMEYRGYASAEELDSVRAMFASNPNNLMAGTR